MPDAPAPTFSTSALGQAAAATVAAQQPAAPAAQPAAKPAAPAAKPAAPAKPATTTPLAATTPEKPTQPWEKVPDTATPAEEPAAAPVDGADETAPEGMKPEQESRWKELRREAQEGKKASEENAQLKAQLDEFKTKGTIPDELTKEVDELRQFRAAFAVREDPKFIAAVSIPLEERKQELRDVATEAGIPVEKLFEATDEPNPVKRNKAIAALLREAPNDVELEVQGALDTAKAMHVLYATGHRLEQQAQELQAIIKGQGEQKTQAEQIKAETEYKAAHSEVFTALSTKLGEVFKDETLKTTVQNAKAATTPMERAYHAQAAELLPEITKKWLAARNELAALQKTEKAKIAARPSVGTPPSTSADDTAPRVSLREAQAAQLRGMSTI